jgi:hypothetical protein
MLTWQADVALIKLKLLIPDIAAAAYLKFDLSKSMQAQSGISTAKKSCCALQLFEGYTVADQLLPSAVICLHNIQPCACTAVFNTHAPAPDGHG